MFDARGLFRTDSFFLSFSPLLFFRVITDKRLKREFSATNIDRETYSGGKEEGKRKKEREPRVRQHRDPLFESRAKRYLFNEDALKARTYRSPMIANG